MSDGLNIRFGKGPLRQAQGPGFSCGTVSELASGEPAEPVELAVEQKGSGLNAINLRCKRLQNKGLQGKSGLVKTLASHQHIVAKPY